LRDDSLETVTSFSYAILDSIDQEIAVIQKNGQIVYVNEAWVRFGVNNGIAKVDWLQANYLEICAQSALSDDPGVQEIYAGLAAVVNGQQLGFSYEYPCHSPNEKRWFLMNVVGLTGHAHELFVIIHSNITQRKLAEQQVELLSLRDPLTGLANRRHFMQFLPSEWQRNWRDGTPISLILLDIDDFKQINDQHGHVAGDACLQQIAQRVGQSARRPSDLAVRWGGEEFILVMGNTSAEAAMAIGHDLLRAARQVPSPGGTPCTVSIGVSSALPDTGDCDALIQQADAALYQAKKSGKDRVLRFTIPAP